MLNFHCCWVFCRNSYLQLTGLPVSVGVCDALQPLTCDQGAHAVDLLSETRLQILRERERGKVQVCIVSAVQDRES